MDSEKTRIIGLLFMITAICIFGIFLFLSLELPVAAKNLFLNLSLLFFMLGNTALLYIIIEKLQEK